jgi:hypothetical protein
VKLKGSCHCGAVRFSLESETPYPYMWCYCTICRKTAGGGGYAINIMGSADTLKVKGRTKVYRAMRGGGERHAHRRNIPLSTQSGQMWWSTNAADRSRPRIRYSRHSAASTTGTFPGGSASFVPGESSGADRPGRYTFVLSMRQQHRAGLRFRGRHR